MSARSSLLDAISDSLMAKAEGGGGGGGISPPVNKKRPTSPAEGDTPCKRQQLGAGLLPETAAPIFDISMFGSLPATLNKQESTNGSHNEYTVDPSETESRASSKSPLEGLMYSLGLTKPLAINTNGPSTSNPLLPSCSGPSTALTTSSTILTHDDSPSDSESDDTAVGAVASRALLATCPSLSSTTVPTEDVMLPVGDSLSPFLQNVLAGRVRVEDSDIFCTVPGRLSLLSQASKYSVTVGEIRRRLGHPESLNASLLGGILRRAKSKNGGKMLRDAIQAVGMELPIGRRKSIRISLLTSLVEGEAHQLGRDFSSLCSSEFPADEMAAAIVKKTHSDNEEAKRKRIEQIDGTLELIREFVRHADALAIKKEQQSTAELTPLEEGLQHFEMATHGFGVQAVETGVLTFGRFLEVQRAQLAATRKGVEEERVEREEGHKGASAFTQVKNEPISNMDGSENNDESGSDQSHSLLTLSTAQVKEEDNEQSEGGPSSHSLPAPIPIRPIETQQDQQSQPSPFQQLNPTIQALLSNQLLLALLQQQRQQ